jgi:Xaa-Pro aminopeptidase
MRHLAPLLLIFGCTAAPPASAPTPAPVPTQDAARAAAAGAWELPQLPQPAPLAAAEFASRRQRLLERLDDGVLVVFGSPAPAFDYLPYEQNPDFRYLTGIMEPDAAYLAVKRAGRVEELLFVQPRDPARELWEGTRLGPAGARERTGIAALPGERFVAMLDSLAAVHPVLHTPTVPQVQGGLGAHLTYAQQVLGRLRERHPDVQIRTVQGQVRQLRAVKSHAELDRIRRAVHISALAHREAMRALEPGMNEFEIRALLEYMFLRNGAEGPAYSSIVGSGPNSTILHYRAADRFMADGEVLLIDAAASYGGYAADVTRTLPVNGRYSPEQRAIYDVVLAAQKAAESRIRRGATWPELRTAADHELRHGLARLGLIDGPDATYDCGHAGALSQCMQYRLFYMHGLGHGVGLAVHDPDISETDAGFQPGSAVTIEPGIYVRADTFDYLPDTPVNRAMIQRLRAGLERYVNIGVRIEDVYVFDERGVERVSRGVPREIDEIEALMREQSFAGPSRRAGMVDWYRLNLGR